jgi:hypothetical protein
MMVRRRRQHPPDFGRASTFVETIDLPVLAPLSERFLREIDWAKLLGWISRIYSSRTNWDVRSTLAAHESGDDGSDW